MADDKHIRVTLSEITRKAMGDMIRANLARPNPMLVWALMTPVQRRRATIRQRIWYRFWFEPKRRLRNAVRALRGADMEIDQ
jgi:hypothetical protein